MLPNVLPHSASDHIPVLADEVRDLLAVQPGETVVDATFGAGGHARLLAEDLRGSGKLVAIDRDPSAKAYFDRFKAQAGVDVRFLRGDFALVLTQLAANDVKADAILLDLGVSSMQIDRPERGFSYATDAPLDMRMDPSGEITAATIVNTWDERELATIFRRYGEERYAGPIARAIVRRRAERAVRAHRRPRRRDQAGDPDARALRRGAPGQARLPGAADRGQRRARPARGRAPGGGRDAPARRPARRDLLPLARGPDRQAVPRRRREGLHLPARLPGLRLRQGAELRVLTRKPVRPSAAEIDRNPRAASARVSRRRGEASDVDDRRREPSPAATRRPAAGRRRPRARAGSRAASSGSSLVGVLLAGVVAVNVVVLQLNVQLDGLGRERAQLKADIARLRSQLSSASANARIEEAARRSSACRRPTRLTTTYVRLRPRSERAAREPPHPPPARRLRPPLRRRSAARPGCRACSATASRGMASRSTARRSRSRPGAARSTTARASRSRSASRRPPSTPTRATSPTPQRVAVVARQDARARRRRALPDAARPVEGLRLRRAEGRSGQGGSAREAASSPASASTPRSGAPTRRARSAPHVLGFAGTDNKGLDGLERSLDGTLVGQAGLRDDRHGSVGRAIDVVTSRPSDRARTSS